MSTRQTRDIDYETRLTTYKANIINYEPQAPIN
jgi:hypothetical protein